MRAVGINCQPVPREAEQQRADLRGQHRAKVSARAGDWSELPHQAQAPPGPPLIGMGLDSSTSLGKYKTQPVRVDGGRRISRKNGNPRQARWPWVQVYTSDVVCKSQHFHTPGSTGLLCKMSLILNEFVSFLLP